MGMVVIAGLVIGIISAFLVIGSVIAQIGGEPSRIVAFAEEVANGNLDLSIVKGKKQGILAALTKMVDHLKKAQDEMVENRKAVELRMRVQKELLGRGIFGDGGLGVAKVLRVHPVPRPKADKTVHFARRDQQYDEQY